MQRLVQRGTIRFGDGAQDGGMQVRRGVNSAHARLCVAACTAGAAWSCGLVVVMAARDLPHGAVLTAPALVGGGAPCVGAQRSLQLRVLLSRWVYKCDVGTLPPGSRRHGHGVD